MPGEVHRIELAPVEGAVDEAAWGQECQYDSHLVAGTGDALLVSVTCRILAGHGLDEVLAALRTVLERHDAFRTGLTVGPSGTLGQVRHERAGVDVVVFRAPSPDAVDAVLAEFATPVVPLATLFGPPELAVCVVRAPDEPRVLYLACPHVFVDAWGVELFRDQFLDLLAGRDGPTGGPAGDSAGDSVDDPVDQPLDRARKERDADHRRISGAAVEHWSRLLDQIPAGRWARPGAGSAWVATVLSPGAAGALDVLADAHNASTSTVLLAGTLLALSCATGEPAVPMKSECHNRLFPVDQHHVGSLVQPGLLLVDTGACAGFGDLVRAVRVASVRAYRFGRYDPRELRAAIGAAEAARGGTLRVPFCFNDLRGAGVRPASDGPPPPGPWSAPGPVELSGPFEPDGYSDLYLSVAADVGGLRIEARFHDSRFSPAEAAAFLLAMDRVLVAAARDQARTVPQLRQDAWSVDPAPDLRLVDRPVR